MPPPFSLKTPFFNEECFVATTSPKSAPINRVAPVRFGSVTVRAWDGSSGSGFRFQRLFWGKDFLFQYCFNRKGRLPVPVSVPEKRFRRLRFLFRFLERRFRRFRFPVPGSSCINNNPWMAMRMLEVLKSFKVPTGLESAKGEDVEEPEPAQERLASSRGENAWSCFVRAHPRLEKD